MTGLFVLRHADREMARRLESLLAGGARPHPPGPDRPYDARRDPAFAFVAAGRARPAVLMLPAPAGYDARAAREAREARAARRFRRFQHERRFLSSDHEEVITHDGRVVRRGRVIALGPGPQDAPQGAADAADVMGWLASLKGSPDHALPAAPVSHPAPVSVPAVSSASPQEVMGWLASLKGNPDLALRPRPQDLQSADLIAAEAPLRDAESPSALLEAAVQARGADWRAERDLYESVRFAVEHPDHADAQTLPSGYRLERAEGRILLRHPDAPGLSLRVGGWVGAPLGAPPGAGVTLFLSSRRELKQFTQEVEDRRRPAPPRRGRVA